MSEFYIKIGKYIIKVFFLIIKFSVFYFGHVHKHIYFYKNRIIVLNLHIIKYNNEKQIKMRYDDFVFH